MKDPYNIRSLFLFFCLLAVSYNVAAQNDSTKPELSVAIHHLVVNNKFQYLMIETKTKMNNKWQPLKKQVLQLYLDSSKSENLINKVMTDSNGRAKALIPPRLKTLWDGNATHKFIVVTEGTFKEEETTTESEITKGKILIDTSNSDGTRSVVVQVMKSESGNWVPVKDVEVKIGVMRLGGDLRIGDEETYTTDSLGQASGEFKLDSLPGDSKGSLILIAKVEDNDQLGSLSIEKIVPWGKMSKPVGHSDFGFGQRSLWAARGKAPIWLMVMAYSIIAGVWTVIFYLVFRLVRIKQLGKQDTQTKEAHE
jgi:hypothetical protein